MLLKERYFLHMHTDIVSKIEGYLRFIKPDTIIENILMSLKIWGCIILK